MPDDKCHGHIWRLEYLVDALLEGGQAVVGVVERGSFVVHRVNEHPQAEHVTRCVARICQDTLWRNVVEAGLGHGRHIRLQVKAWVTWLEGAENVHNKSSRTNSVSNLRWNTSLCEEAHLD